MSRSRSLVRNFPLVPVMGVPPSSSHLSMCVFKAAPVSLSIDLLLLTYKENHQWNTIVSNKLPYIRILIGISQCIASNLPCINMSSSEHSTPPLCIAPVCSSPCIGPIIVGEQFRLVHTGLTLCIYVAVLELCPGSVAKLLYFNVVEVHCYAFQCRWIDCEHFCSSINYQLIAGRFAFPSCVQNCFVHSWQRPTWPEHLVISC